MSIKKNKLKSPETAKKVVQKNTSLKKKIKLPTRPKISKPKAKNTEIIKVSKPSIKTKKVLDKKPDIGIVKEKIIKGTIDRIAGQKTAGSSFVKQPLPKETIAPVHKDVLVSQVEEIKRIPKPQVLPQVPKEKTSTQETLKVTQPQVEIVPSKEGTKKIIEIDIPIVLKDLAVALQEKPSVLIKKLLEHKIIVNLNQSLNEELASKMALEYGYQIKRKPTDEELLIKEHEVQDVSKLKPRSPIVTFMGHVDHGKTSLLDAIRKSKVADGEYGGITQHIGAYKVSLRGGNIAFLDTPGHEAFTAMRARGAKVTDIVVLVVAADDGVMPQTIEAIDHAREANVPIIVAINKIDKPQVNIDLIKKELSKLGFAPEDWGGKTIMVGVSAKTGEGIDQLLEMILLEAEMLELKADPSRLAKGVVLESKITEGRGPVATLLVENGTLHVQDIIIVGSHYAKIRAMFNEFGKPLEEAVPSTPVEILGLSGLPEAGEQFFAVADEKKARDLALKRKEQIREKELRPIKIMSLEELSGQIKEGKVKELKLILKADVGGSLEAINESLKKLETSEVKLNIIHQGVGSINVSDIVLAQASGAIILGFHVACDERSKEEFIKSGVDIRTYNVIYELYNDLKTALEGMLSPKLKRIFLGRALVRQVFKLSRAGVVAGSYVEKGKITRSAKVTLLRNGGVVYEGSISSLKRFKDDVREVGEGMECGISLSGFNEVMQDDIIEAYEIEKIARKIE